MNNSGERVASSGQHDRIIFAELNGLAGQSRGFGDFLLAFNHQTGCLSPDIATCAIGVSGCENRVQFDSPRKQSHGLIETLMSILMSILQEMLHPTQIVVVGT